MCLRMGLDKTEDGCMKTVRCVDDETRTKACVCALERLMELMKTPQTTGIQEGPV